MEIKLATLEHFDGIRALLKANHVNTIDPVLKKDGFVTTNLTDEQLTTLIVDKQGVTIAEEDGKVLAFALAADWDYWSAWPFFQYMIQHLEEYEMNGEKLTVENSYQYGPVCVDHSVRGTGVFEQVFNFSLATMSLLSRLIFCHFSSSKARGWHPTLIFPSEVGRTRPTLQLELTQSNSSENSNTPSGSVLSMVRKRH